MQRGLVPSLCKRPLWLLIHSGLVKLSPPGAAAATPLAVMDPFCTSAFVAGHPSDIGRTRGQFLPPRERVPARTPCERIAFLFKCQVTRLTRVRTLIS